MTPRVLQHRRLNLGRTEGQVSAPHSGADIRDVWPHEPGFSMPSFIAISVAVSKPMPRISRVALTASKSCPRTRTERFIQTGLREWAYARGYHSSLQLASATRHGAARNSSSSSRQGQEAKSTFSVRRVGSRDRHRPPSEFETYGCPTNPAFRCRASSRSQWRSLKPMPRISRAALTASAPPLASISMTSGQVAPELSHAGWMTEVHPIACTPTSSFACRSGVLEAAGRPKRAGCKGG